MGKVPTRGGLVLAAWLGVAPWLTAQTVSPASSPPLAAEDVELTGLLDKMGALGERLAKTQETAEIVALNLEQANVLARITARCKPEERPDWLRQMADCLHTAAVNSPASDKTAYTRLVRLEEQLTQAMPGSNLTAYAAYRSMQVDYFARLGTPGNDAGQTQEHWRHQLERFVQAYPHADETPNAVLELGTLSEALGKEGDAKRSFQYLLDHFPNHPFAAKARTSLNRLELLGRVLHLTLPLLSPDDEHAEVPFDLDQLQGKVVVVYFWASSSPRAAADFGALNRLAEHYQDKGLELLCVNLDKTPDEAREFLHRYPAAGVHVFQQGGLEGKAVVGCGVTSFASLLVVGKDGKVVNRTAGISELEEPILKHLEDPAPVQAGTEPSRIRHSPWKR